MNVPSEHALQQELRLIIYRFNIVDIWTDDDVKVRNFNQTQQILSGEFDRRDFINRKDVLKIKKRKVSSDKKWKRYWQNCRIIPDIITVSKELYSVKNQRRRGIG